MSENLKSTPVTNLDATPVVVPTVGEGCPGFVKKATDVVFPTSAVAQWSTYRLCRIPTRAKIKRVDLYTKGIDTNATATATLDINLAFSDTSDGTNANLQGTIPSSNHDGTSFAFVTNTGYSTSYANSGTGNKLFGSAIALPNSGTATSTDITFKNTASSGFVPANRDDDIWDVLGFVNGLGIAQDPGGFFDFLVVVSAAVATAAAGTIGLSCDYVD